MTVTRNEQKERTRRALLDAALRLSDQAGGVAAMSLRQLTKEVGVVPTAFYRHFESVEGLGLVLVDESFAILRAMLREVRQGQPEPKEIITRSVGVLVEHVNANRGQFGFLVRERVTGPPAVRDAVRRELELVERELATDLARIPAPHWSSEDFLVLANLLVGAMVNIVGDLLDATPGSRSAETLPGRAEKQLRMVVIGSLNWRSDYSDN